jgi:hypothetical protein
LAGVDGEVPARRSAQDLSPTCRRRSLKSGKFGAKVNVSLEGASTPQLGTFGIAVDGAFQNDARAPKSSFDSAHKRRVAAVHAAARLAL